MCYLVIANDGMLTSCFELIDRVEGVFRPRNVCANKTAGNSI